MGDESTRDGICGICPAGCWIRARIEDGKLVQVDPRPDHPLGAICHIGSHSPAIVHDPDRLVSPLKRTGPKGDDAFEPISWEQAYEEIVNHLEQLKDAHGPESTAIYTGRGSFDMALCDLFQPAGIAVSSASSVLFPFGSPNTLGVGALCYVSFAMIAPHVTMGEMFITMDTEVEQADLIVVWGANPATDSPPRIHQQILAARARGAAVVAIDPRRTRTARQAGADWIPIRPGTDGALALGLINVLIEEELYDEEFVKQWTVGFEELSQMVQNYPPSVVASITSVPAETVVQLARRLARARGAAPIMYTGLEYSDSGVQAIRAVLALFALAGHLDVPGGLVIRMKQNSFPQNRSGLIPNPNIRKALGRDRFPIYSHYRGESHAIALPKSVLEGDPYKIRGLIVLGGSIVTSWPQPNIWKRTLAALDYLVCIDRYLTGDAAYADIVLPATTGYENVSYMRYGPLFAIRERLVEPQGEARNDFLILAELAARLGYGHLYPQTEEEILAYALKETPFTVEEVRAQGGYVQIEAAMMEYKKWEKGLLREDGRPGFDTPSGKFELASSLLEEHGYDPLPIYTEPREGPLAAPDLAKRFPLVFNSGSRTIYDFRSQHHGVDGLRQSIPVPFVLIHPEDAASRGIRDGDSVAVETPRGSVSFVARVTDDIVKGAIDAAMGGGGPLGSSAWQESNVNHLTDLDHYDPISGFPVYKTLLCEVRLLSHSDRMEPSPAGSEAWLPVAQEEERSPIYLDAGATTPLLSEVQEAMAPYWQEAYGNPSSIHGQGARARDAVESARRSIAHVLNCTARRILFVGSGSEADNLAIKGAALAHRDRGRHIVTTAIEHPAVLSTCRYLEQEGFEVSYLPVDRHGLIDKTLLDKTLRDETVLVSVMMANNEIGTIQPIAALASATHARGALFHTDAVQALGKLPIDLEELPVDLLSVSAHKIHGPKGVGALFVRKGVALVPLIHGGGQERGLRASTENVPGIVGFGKACELAAQRLDRGDLERVRGLRDRLEQGVLALHPDARRNGHRELRLPNVSSMTLPRIRGESLVYQLDRLGVSLSSGSACKAGNPDPSHVLKAIGLSDEAAHCSVRFSLCPGTTEEEIDEALTRMREVLQDPHGGIRFVTCR